jgi:hypothetical protein
MLFLLNDTVFELAGASSLAARLCPPGRRLTDMRLNEAIVIAQTAFFENAEFYKANPDLGRAVCWLLAAHNEITGGLFIRPGGARRPIDVKWRLACVSFPTLGGLMARQKEGRLGPMDINQAVWLKAA